MVFFDLNIPYRESDRNLSNKEKSKQKTDRLKLTIKAAELGYTGIAYNREIKGIMSESDRCAIPLFPLSSLIKASPSLSTTVKFHRELLKVPVSTPFRQYTRLTVVVDSPAQVSALNSGNPILKSYDIVAVRPMNQNAFEQACQTSEVDVIAIDFSEKLPFRLKQPVIKTAIKRGLFFEITYCSLIRDVSLRDDLVRDGPARRQMISNAKLLVEWTRGKNLIVSSSAPSVSEIRGPCDVANLLSLLGLTCERAKTAVSKNCRSIIASALRKKQYYKEAIKIEVMPSSGQCDSKEYKNDWLKWDPISSGEGDLLLDDIEKGFSASVSNYLNHVRLASALNSLPSHHLQIKHTIPANTSPEPQDIARRLDNYQDNYVPAAVNGISEHEDLIHEDSSISLLQHRPGNDSIHDEENRDHLADSNDLRAFKQLDAYSSPSKTGLHALPSQSSSEKNVGHVPLADDETICRCEIDTETIQTFDGFAESSLHLEDALGNSNSEESKMQISFPVGMHVEEDNKAEPECKNYSELAAELGVVTLNQELRENEQVQTKVDHLGSLAGDLHCQSKEENVFAVDKSEQMQEGKLVNQMSSETPITLSYEIRGGSLSGEGRRKRRMPYQPVLYSSRNLLTSRTPKRRFIS